MPHITEDTVANLRDRIVPGVTLTPRFWGDADAPHRFLSGTHHAIKIKGKLPEPLELQYYYYKADESRHVGRVYLRPTDVVAIVEMKPLGKSDSMTYAHHDDRLILPGGYMDAHPGTMHRVWDVYFTNGNPPRRNVTVAEGRALLAAVHAHRAESAAERIMATIRTDLTPHIGHTVQVSGPGGTSTGPLTERQLAGDSAGWNFMGYVVECKTCGGPSLSQDWGIPC